MANPAPHQSASCCGDHVLIAYRVFWSTMANHPSRVIVFRVRGALSEKAEKYAGIFVPASLNILKTGFYIILRRGALVQL